MTENIDNIGLWKDNPKRYNKIDLVKIEFKFPCDWTTLDLRDLKRIIELWIEGEEKVYPMIKEGREKCHLFKFIESIFIEKLKWSEKNETKRIPEAR